MSQTRISTSSPGVGDRLTTLEAHDRFRARDIAALRRGADTLHRRMSKLETRWRKMLTILALLAMSVVTHATPMQRHNILQLIGAALE